MWCLPKCANSVPTLARSTGPHDARGVWGGAWRTRAPHALTSSHVSICVDTCAHKQCRARRQERKVWGTACRLYQQARRALGPGTAPRATKLERSAPSMPRRSKEIFHNDPEALGVASS
eukprot:2124940-Prymnesium_polylepis.1